MPVAQAYYNAAQELLDVDNSLLTEEIYQDALQLINKALQLRDFPEARQSQDSISAELEKIACRRAAMAQSNFAYGQQAAEQFNYLDAMAYFAEALKYDPNWAAAKAAHDKAMQDNLNINANIVSPETDAWIAAILDDEVAPNQNTNTTGVKLDVNGFDFSQALTPPLSNATSLVAPLSPLSNTSDSSIVENNNNNNDNDNDNDKKRSLPDVQDMNKKQKLTAGQQELKSLLEDSWINRESKQSSPRRMLSPQWQRSSSSSSSDRDKMQNTVQIQKTGPTTRHTVKQKNGQTN